MNPSHAHQRRTLPGDTSPDGEVARMIRVNQAGEYGAARIYAGQLAVLGKKKSGALIRHMAEQEQQHLNAFNRMMGERHVRPTALQPLWHVAGFALGAATALMGEKAAMACTVAVESVINDHYAAQENVLDENEAELKHTIAQFRQEEMEHHDTGIANGAEETPFYHALNHAIQCATRSAIWLSTRV